MSLAAGSRHEAPAGSAQEVPDDPFDATVVRRTTEPLASFNRAGVLAPSDVHVATRLARLGADSDPWVALAAALAVRAPRHGHVCVDLETARRTVAASSDGTDEIAALAWPDVEAWVVLLQSSPLVAVGDGGMADRPLRLLGSNLYLDRYWRDEVAVAADLDTRAARPPLPCEDAVVAGLLASLFPGPGAADQREAAATAVLRLLTVIAGGPGTGKTTAVARIVGLLHATATGRPPLVALAAPTGKAAARLGEAVRAESERLPLPPAIRDRVRATGASTIHRLLGATWGSGSRFRHDRHHRLPHDVVIVDETSMVSLSLMARLTEAVRPDARLILVGDPNQLASVEAGAVLGDIVGPAAQGSRLRPPARARLAALTGVSPTGVSPTGVSPTGVSPTGVSPTGVSADQAGGAAADAPMGDSVILLRHGHRFGGAIARLAEAVRLGDGDGAIAALAQEDGGLRWMEADPAEASDAALAELRAGVEAASTPMLAAARQGRAGDALEALDRFRVLCAHRHGPDGVSGWNDRIEGWLGLDQVGVEGPQWYIGRPVLVTENDYSLRLFNGDTGVVVARPDGAPEAVLATEAGQLRIGPARLAAVQTVFAMTVHKSQGSQFESVAVVLPSAAATVLTRELLYTAVTRARRSVLIAGTEDAIRAAIARPVGRASGLTERLW